MFDGFVIEINDIRREEDEDQDQRHHHIELNGASLVRPEDVAANCAPDVVHRQRGYAGCACFNALQV
jgi:hypothetical protein